MKISVVYALSDRQIEREVELPDGSTVAHAVEQSGLLLDFSEIDLKVTFVGVYGRVMPLDATLQPGDRVEIYRKLLKDPKETRLGRIGKR